MTELMTTFKILNFQLLIQLDLLCFAVFTVSIRPTVLHLIVSL